MVLKLVMLLKLGVIFTRATTRLRVTDAHNGLRLLSRKAFSEIALRQLTVAHASELVDQV